MSERMSGLHVHGADLVANAIIYEYPCGAVDIICANAHMFKAPGWEEAGAEPPQRAKRARGKKSEGSDQVRSMQRARAKVRRLALANEFRWFVTLTLDKEKIDRYDPEVIAKALSRWADNMVRRHGLRYILIPEMHKDGAFHFHGFFAGDLEAVDSGKEFAGRPVYNLPQWPYGFTTAQELYGDYQAAVTYCCKYIGKQGGQRPMGRWYYSGGRLQEPHKEYTVLDYNGLAECGEAVEFSIPGSKMLVIHTKKEENTNE